MAQSRGDDDRWTPAVDVRRRLPPALDVIGAAYRLEKAEADSAEVV